nr:hypothetical protein Iba_chr09bCG10590 [Ipomoea batatas]
MGGDPKQLLTRLVPYEEFLCNVEGLAIWNCIDAGIEVALRSSRLLAPGVKKDNLELTPNLQVKTPTLYPVLKASTMALNPATAVAISGTSISKSAALFISQHMQLEEIKASFSSGRSSINLDYGVQKNNG